MFANALIAGLVLQAYSRDLLLFLFLILTIVAFATSMQPVKRELILNRPQTEEWKGWMQVRTAGWPHGC